MNINHSLANFSSGIIYLFFCQLRSFGKTISDAIANRQEVKVWQKQDRHGNSYWQVYDPITGQSGSFGSEQEVMAWIESLYR